MAVSCHCAIQHLAEGQAKSRPRQSSDGRVGTSRFGSEVPASPDNETTPERGSDSPGNTQPPRVRAGIWAPWLQSPFCPSRRSLQNLGSDLAGHRVPWRVHFCTCPCVFSVKHLRRLGGHQSLGLSWLGCCPLFTTLTLGV